MTEFYRFYAQKENMYLWDTFMSFRFSPSKGTETGVHQNAVMISVGRRMKSHINKEQFKALPNGTQDSIIQKHSLESFLRPEISFRDRVANGVIKSYLGMDKKIRKALGIRLSRDPSGSSFELFQFLKFRSIEEMLPISHGYGRSLGVQSWMSNMSEDDLEKLIREVQGNIRKAILQGHDMAKQEGWK